jgi:acyl transferase domain-containing protein
MPIVLSASSERALKATMERLLEFLTDNPNVSMQDLGWTLIENRSTLSVRRALSAQTASAACAALQLEIAAIESKQSSFVKTEHKFKTPNLLGIFTGQGEPWKRRRCEINAYTNRGAMACYGKEPHHIDPIREAYH